jgi:hypothetical protein
MNTTAVADTKTRTAEPKKTQGRGRRNFNVRLDGASGSQMRVAAQRRKDGTAVTFVVRTGKKKVHDRGATEEHASLQVAQARADALVAQLTKLGWKQREARGGFARKPDAFDAEHLPGPGAPAGQTSKKR